MPVLDKQLKELQAYEGTNPKPDNFEHYWEKALCELKHTPAKPEFIPADFQTDGAVCYDLYFTGVGNARIYAKCIIPEHKDGEKMPAVLHFHGYTVSSSDWTTYLSYALSGFVVFALDVRGQGGKSVDVGGVCGNTQHGHIIRGLEEDDPQKLFYRNVFLDTAQLASIALQMPEVDQTRVATFGASQGGALAIACAALEPRIARVAACYPFLCDYKKGWEMDSGSSAYGELREFFRHFDPRHENEDKWYTKLGYIDLQYLAPRVKAEVKMATGLMDNVCPPHTQFAAYNKMTCNKTSIVYPDFGHETLPDWSDITYKFMCEM